MKKEAIVSFFSTLQAANPEPETELEYDTPFELLIAVLLSAQATDVGVNKATRRLFPVANTPAAILALGEETLKGYINTIGLYNAKAANVIALCRQLLDLHDGEVPHTREALEALPGVGRKTANVVLGNAFGVPGITPDTHFIRLSNRFGWVSSKNPDAVERAVGDLFDPADWVMLCHRVIWHGRRRCHARRPACGACPLAGLCPAYGEGPTDPEVAAKLVREPRA